ncbi:hypothetical protein HV331_25055 (plasmid) [Klebsiella aerogenes]|uniref:Transposase n=1 Tax=Klebsiella aerogenes TaxID=548 RepID=A0AAP9R2F8_KLEAE|nr:hypothetical protein HV331_25055 [Klebsiella aerogenes]
MTDKIFMRRTECGNLTSRNRIKRLTRKVIGISRSVFHYEKSSASLLRNTCHPDWMALPLYSINIQT